MSLLKPDTLNRLLEESIEQFFKGFEPKDTDITILKATLQRDMLTIMVHTATIMDMGPRMFSGFTALAMLGNRLVKEINTLKELGKLIKEEKEEKTPDFDGLFQNLSNFNKH